MVLIYGSDLPCCRLLISLIGFYWTLAIVSICHAQYSAALYVKIRYGIKRFMCWRNCLYHPCSLLLEYRRCDWDGLSQMQPYIASTMRLIIVLRPGINPARPSSIVTFSQVFRLDYL